MVIAIDTGIFFNKQKDGYILQNILMELARKETSWKCILLIDNQYSINDNATKKSPVSFTPPILSPLTEIDFNNVQTINLPAIQILKSHRNTHYIIPKLLQQHNATVFVTTGKPLQKQKNLKQILLFTKAMVAEKNIAKKLSCFDGFLIADNELRTLLQQNYSIQAERIFDAGIFVSPALKPVSIERAIEVKNTVANGREYFICADFEMNNEKLIFLLKAFSIFKKMQHSNWKLMLKLRLLNPKQEIEKLLAPLKNYKYTADVIINYSHTTANFAEEMAAAYALLTFEDKDSITAREAFSCGIPVIAVAKKELSDQAAAIIYTGGNKPEQLADSMMLLYKNESLKNTYKVKAQETASQYHPELLVEQLAQWIKR